MATHPTRETSAIGRSFIPGRRREEGNDAASWQRMSVYGPAKALGVDLREYHEKTPCPPCAAIYGPPGTADTGMAVS